jgi:hypothetical protein
VKTSLNPNKTRLSETDVIFHLRETEVYVTSHCFGAYSYILILSLLIGSARDLAGGQQKVGDVAQSPWPPPITFPWCDRLSLIL